MIQKHDKVVTGTNLVMHVTTMFVVYGLEASSELLESVLYSETLQNIKTGHDKRQWLVHWLAVWRPKQVTEAIDAYRLKCT